MAKSTAGEWSARAMLFDQFFHPLHKFLTRAGADSIQSFNDRQQLRELFTITVVV
jgi:hypothetical protein